MASMVIVDIIIIDDLWEITCKIKGYKEILRGHNHGKVQRFEVDSGAGFTLLSKSYHNALKLSIPMHSNIQFHSYTREIFQLLGVTEVPIECKTSNKEMARTAKYELECNLYHSKSEVESVKSIKGFGCMGV